MQTILTIVQLVSLVIMIACILLQQRGVGLGSAFGGEGNVFRTRRGIEKGIFVATVVFAIIFFASAFLNFIWPQLS